MYLTSWWFQHVSTHLKNINQIWNLPQIGVKHLRNICQEPPNSAKYRLPTYNPQTQYGWWTKSCTSWYGKYPIIYRVSYIPGGCLGFLPSTVATNITMEAVQLHRHPHLSGESCQSAKDIRSRSLCPCLVGGASWRLWPNPKGSSKNQDDPPNSQDLYINLELDILIYPNEPSSTT